jgi:hypothetical protein
MKFSWALPVFQCWGVSEKRTESPNTKMKRDSKHVSDFRSCSPQSQCVSCDQIEERRACAWDWGDHRSKHLDWAIFLTHRASYEGVRPKGEEEPKAYHKDVQDTMESSYGRRSNLGDGKLSQHQVLEFSTISKPQVSIYLPSSLELNLETRFRLRGVGCDVPGF